MNPHEDERPTLTALLVLSVALALLLTILATQPGCAHWTVDHPTCGLRRGAEDVSFCCEAGIAGELDAGVASLNVTGLVEGCARVRGVRQEVEERRPAGR